MKKIFYAIIFLPFISLLSVHCAQEGQLTGGPKDTIPPAPVKIKPQLPDTGFEKNKIIIKFNEFVQLNNIQQNFFCSPPLPDKPKFKIRGKKLIINLSEPLQDSTTYYIVLDNAIEDYTEKNPLKKLELIFSTYDQIDSLQCAGSIKNAYTNLPQNNLTVTAYDFEDTLFWKHFPNYIAITDSGGYFSFKHLKKGKYRIFAFNDMNSNFIFDGFPETIVGFSDNPIIPYTKTDTLRDTLKTGTIIMKDTIADTLKKDTIIISYQTHYFPDSIEIRVFNQTPDSVSIKRISRILRCQLAIYFTAPLVNNYLKLYAISNKQFFVQKFSSKDSIYIWLIDSALYNADTLKIISEYFLTPNGPKTLDTLIFEEAEKFSDTLPLEISLKEKNPMPGNFLILQSSIPMKKFIKEKIHLFTILDTTVTEDAKQNFSILRPENDTLYIKFKRPLVKGIKLDFYDIPNDSIHYIVKYDSNKQNVIVKLTDTALINDDTLQFILHYDNLYFFDMIQNLKSKEKIPVLHQKYTIKRPENKKIIISLSKKIKLKPQIMPLNFSEKDFKTTWTGDSLIFNFNKQFKDTLIFVLKIYDKKNIDGTPHFLTDTVKSFYLYKGNPLIKAERYAKHKIRLIFDHDLISKPNVKILNFKPFRMWYKIKFLDNKDTAYILITNNRVKRLKKIRLALTWKDKSPEGETITMQDTLNLQVTQNHPNYTINNNDKKNSIHLTLQKPMDFSVSIDSTIRKKIIIKSRFVSGRKYLVQTDSTAFTSICGNTTDTLTFHIRVNDTSEIIKPIFVIKSIEKDSSHNIYAEGQIIMHLLDKDNNKILSSSFQKDTTFAGDLIPKGNYKAIFIFDKDKNGIQTNGSLQNLRQPEKIKIKNIQIDQDTVRIKL